MYPDTDSPPQRVTRERVEGLRASLPELPWSREARYTKVGVPTPVIHYLIRRGGARLVDAVVELSGADLRRACFFFGERLKGLRRAGIAVDELSDERWRELFAMFDSHPVAWEAWRSLVERLVDCPDIDLQNLVDEMALGRAPDGWRERVAGLAAELLPEQPDGSEDQMKRFLMGRAMGELRGRVPSTEVDAEIRNRIGAEHE